MPSRMTSSQFMQSLPGAVRRHLPAPRQRFRTSIRSWLCQLYYRDPRLHYEVWNFGQRRGLLEVGLHFESRDRATNQRYLARYQRCMFEVKAALGREWEAEPWDKGWTKVYTTLPLEDFADDYLERVASVLAQAILVLQPIFEDGERDP
jgi:hypothetical protein